MTKKSDQNEQPKPEQKQTPEQASPDPGPEPAPEGQDEQPEAAQKHDEEQRKAAEQEGPAETEIAQQADQPQGGSATSGGDLTGTQFEAANEWTPEQKIDEPEPEPFNLGGKDIQYLASESSDADVEAADIRLTQEEKDEGNTLGQTTNPDDDKDSGVHG